MYLRHGAVVPHRVPISPQWRMNFWAAGVRVVSDFRAYEHFCNFYLFRNYQINRTLVKRFLGVAGELLRESRFYGRCASELALAFGTHPLAVKRSDPRNPL